MQTPSTTQIVCPKPSDAQIQAQIENLHWNERQQEKASQFQRDFQLRQQQMEQQRVSVQHTEYMVDHLALPGAGVSVALIAAFVITRLGQKSIAADVQRNRDNNEADVAEAKRIIDKHEASDES